MAKKKRKRKAGASRGTPSGNKAPRGFDYGCLPHAMAVGYYEFPNQLGEASVIGVAYGETWSDEIKRRVPTVTLVAQRGEPLAKAFDTFNAWAASTDPDAIELTIVVSTNGGYILSLSPEMSRLERRCLGFDRTHSLTFVMTTWSKPIDTVHPFLRQLQEYSRQPVAPFYLSGATHPAPITTLAGESPPALRPIPGLQALLKFEATLVDELDVEPGTTAAMALQIASSNKSDRQRNGRHIPPSPSHVSKQRVTTLRTHFPVTLERIQRTGEVREMARELARDGIAIGQIEQALCNLTLSRDLRAGSHYASILTPKFVDHVRSWQ